MDAIGVILNMISSSMRTEELLQELKKSNAELEAQAKELEDAKKAWLQERAVGRSQDQNLLGALVNNEFHGRTYAFQANLDKKVEALTLHDVNTAVRKVLSLDSLSVFKAGDFKKAGIPQ